VPCQATRLNPGSARESPLKCDDECLRLQRNRRLAEALNVDPDHTDDHVPYSDMTLKMFRETGAAWAQAQEREFRVFAESSDEKRLRFRPMQPQQRAFLHALAEDYGFDSESQDFGADRHVCLFKTPRFVSAPRKTLAQCLRIVNAAAALSTARPAAVLPEQQSQAFNALLIKDLRFGLTLDELDQTLKNPLAAVSRSGPALTFATTFLPSDEILIKATPTITAASIATSLAPTPQAVEATLTSLKATVEKLVTRDNLAGAVTLVHADASLNITRRQGDAASGGKGGWNTVASRNPWRKTATAGASGGGPGLAAAQARAPSAFMALKKPEAKKKAVAPVQEPVEEDWLVAAEKMEGEGESGGEGAKTDLDKEESADVVKVVDAPTNVVEA
jgi:transcriptional repressor NF-X1